MRRALTALVLLAACERVPPPPAAAAPAAAPAPRAAAEGPARAGGGAGWGEPDMPKLEKLFKRRFPEVKRCYEAELARDERARGKFTLRFTILESGALADVSTAGSTFRRREVPACVAEVVRRWTTPFRPAEPVAVEYPLRFSPR